MLRPLGRDGPAADGGPGHPAPPAILFLDEPTAGLDPQSRLALWEILGELHAAGQTILLTTHYMEEADQLCDRVAIMDHGKILALDTPGRPQEVGDRRHHRDGVVRRRPRRSWPPRLWRLMDGARSAQVMDGVVRIYLPAWAGPAPHHRRRRGRRASRSPTSRSPSPRSRPCSSPSPERTSGNERHRLDPPRPAPAPAGAALTRRPGSPSGRSCCATWPSCARTLPIRGADDHAAAAAAVRVHLRVPQIGQAIGGGGPRRASSPPCSSPAWWPPP